MSPFKKLLSHRLRGFGPYEHSPAAMAAACASEAAFLEVDVRASRDGELFLWHDHRTGKLSDRDLPFSTTSGRDLAQVRYRNGEPILSLRDALTIFAGSRPGQKLCLDIKDYGLEERYLESVRGAGLESRVCFVSWMPQSLLRLRELGTTAPLILSHCNLLQLGPIGTVLDRLMAHRLFRLRWFVLMGRHRAASPLGSLARGFQHALFCRELPEALQAALASSGGGICVQHQLVGASLIGYCRNSGLQLWPFSVRTTQDYQRLAANDGIDVVFCDDAPTVIRDLTR